MVDEAEGYDKVFASLAGASLGGATWEVMGGTVHAAWGCACGLWGEVGMEGG